MGADGINPRVAIGAMILKHLCNTSDRETVLQIQENIYMQYFIGYSSFSNEPPFDPSLFVEFRKRLGIILVLNLIKLIGSGTCVLILSWVTFSASWLEEFIGKISGSDIFQEKMELKVC
jgi:hypothetical protein